jgi:hypothetical protein
MIEPIKQEHNAFGASSAVNDWGFDDDVKPQVEVYVNNGRGSSGYIYLSLEEAHQAIEIIKEAIKTAEKDLKKAEKYEKKRRSRRERF